MGKRERCLFEYINGVLLWKSPTSNRVRQGSVAGSLTTNGYYTVRYDGVCRMLHRVIWDYHHDEGCDGFLLDHINRNRSDNRIENLRLCDYSQNAANSSAHADNTSGAKGIHKHPNGKFRVQISKRGVRHHVGMYVTLDEARIAYAEKARELFGEFNVGGHSNRKA